MKGLIVTAGHKLWLDEDIPMPEMGEYDALVKNQCCIICNGTDNEIIAGNLEEIRNYPVMLGHESAGYVVACGKKVKHYQPGDLVVRSIVRKNEKYFSAWGGFCEYGLVTDYRAMQEDQLPDSENFTIGLMQRKYPESINPVQAAMSITYKETYSALKRLGTLQGSTLVLVGDGPVALCMASVAKLFGVKAIHMIGQNPKTMAVALDLGVTAVYNHLEDGWMHNLRERCLGKVDYYIDTIGNNATIAQGLPLLKKEGTVVVYGLHSGKELQIPLAGMRNFSISFMQFPVHAKEGEAQDGVLNAILEGKIDVDRLVTHVLPLEEYEEAFRLVKSRKGIKVALLL